MPIRSTISQNRDLVDQAGVDLGTDPRNQFDLTNHLGRRSDVYLMEIQADSIEPT